MILVKMNATDGSGAKYALKWQGVHEASLKPVLRDTEVKIAATEGDEDAVADARGRTATRGLSFARFPDGGLRCGRRGETRILGVFVEEKDAPDGGTFRFADVGSSVAEPASEKAVETIVMPETVDAWREYIAKLSPESTYALTDAIRVQPTRIVENSDTARSEVSLAEKAMAQAFGTAVKPETRKAASKGDASSKKAAAKPATGKAAPSKGKAR